MTATMTATPHPEARPPYVELTVDTGSDTEKIYEIEMVRNDEVVRISSTVSPASRAKTFRDYDAPYGDMVTYTSSLGILSTPSGSSSEDWTGSLVTKGWSGATFSQLINQSVRMNAFPDPSIEGDVSPWATLSTVSVSGVTTQAKYGTHSLRLRPNPVTLTNINLNPSMSDGSFPSTLHYSTGSGTTSISPTIVPGAVNEYVIGVTPQNAYSGNSYVNSDAMPVSAGTTYYVHIRMFSRSGLGGIKTRFYNNLDQAIGADVDSTFSVPTVGGVGNTHVVSRLAPAGAVTMRVFPFSYPGSGKLWGTNVPRSWSMDNLMVTTQNFGTGTWDGDTPDTSTYRYDWVDPFDRDDSMSTRRTIIGPAAVMRTRAGLAPGRTYTFSFYVMGAAGSTASLAAIASFPAAGGGAPNIIGTGVNENPFGWTRVSVVFTQPLTTTSADLGIYCSNWGVEGDRFADGFLLEEGNTLLPYFDGSNTTDLTSIAGSWTSGWNDAGHNSSSASCPRSVWSGDMTRTYNYAASEIKFEGFYILNDYAAVTMLMDDNTTLTYSVETYASSPNRQLMHTLSLGGQTSVGFTLGAFSGPMTLSLVGDRATVTFANGSSISVACDSSIIDTLRIDANEFGTNGKILPFTMLPGSDTTTGSASVSTLIEPTSAWLIHPYTPSLSLEVDNGQGQGDGDLVSVTVDSATEVTRPTPTSLLAPIGSKRQIAVSLGSRKAAAWTLGLSTTTAAAYDAVVDITGDAAPLRFDYTDAIGAGICRTGMRIPKGWYSVGDLSESREVEDWRSPIRRWTLPLSPVEAPSATPEQ